MIISLVLLIYLKKISQKEPIFKSSEIPVNPSLPQTIEETKTIIPLNSVPKISVQSNTGDNPRSSPSDSTIKTNLEFLKRVIQLGEIAQENQERVENERELLKKEESKLYLKRLEFKKLYSDLKSSSFDSF
jgi:hypothetical protein